MARQVMNILHLDMPADNTATRGDPQKAEVTEVGETQVSLQPAMPAPSITLRLSPLLLLPVLRLLRDAECVSEA